MSKRAKFQNMNIQGGVSGEYKIIVVKNDGTVTYPLGNKFYKNLILNSGLDMLFANGQAGQGFASVFTACRAGTGNTVTNVADVVLVNQVSAISAYDTTTGANSSTIDTATSSVIHKRTFQFAPAGSNTNYNEVGFSNNTGAGTNLFSRVVLGATVTVLTGEVLKVVYQLKCTLLQTTTGSAVALSNGGFDGTGTIKCVGLYANIFGSISSLGAETVNNASIFLGQLGNGWLLTNSVYPSINTALTSTYAGASQADSQSVTATGTYVGGTFYKNLTYAWSSAVPANTVSTIRAVIFGNVNNGIMWLFNAAQTKANTTSLTLVNRVAWTRV